MARVGSAQYASPIYGQSVALASGQLGYPQSPIYQHRGGPSSGAYASPLFKQEPGAPIPQYSPAYGSGAVVSPAYVGANANGSASGIKNQYVSPIYSPSACIQSPAYTSQVSGKSTSPFAYNSLFQGVQ